MFWREVPRFAGWHIPSTSTFLYAIWLYEEEFEVENYVYQDSQLIRMNESCGDVIS